jgi:hypothetical protein
VQWSGKSLEEQKATTTFVDKQRETLSSGSGHEPRATNKQRKCGGSERKVSEKVAAEVAIERERELRVK